VPPTLTALVCHVLLTHSTSQQINPGPDTPALDIDGSLHQPRYLTKDDKPKQHQVSLSGNLQHFIASALYVLHRNSLDWRTCEADQEVTNEFGTLLRTQNSHLFCPSWSAV